MSTVNYPSRLLEDAVNEFAKLPGIGRKTALRLVLHILRQPADQVEHFSSSLVKLRSEIKMCKSCYNISDTETCPICSDNKRDTSLICVVENIRDVMSIESTGQFRGKYHVLGGIISPMDGISPSDLTIEQLEARIAAGSVSEVIFALSATAEGDTTNFYLYKRLSRYSITISTLARGVAIGDELEYADSLTLGRSIINRIPFNG